MATYQIVAWRGIPASVETREGSETVTRQLSERFHMLIDSAAMQLGLDESDAYIEQWTRSAPAERAGSATDVADHVVAELEQRFPEFIGQAFRH